jgi:hypothetical protein
MKVTDGVIGQDDTVIHCERLVFGKEGSDSTFNERPVLRMYAFEKSDLGGFRLLWAGAEKSEQLR